MPKVQGLTQKEKLALEEYSRNGFNMQEAVFKVYNCSSLKSASSIGTRVLKRLDKVRLLTQEASSYEGKMIQTSREKDLKDLEVLDPDINTESILNRINAIAKADRNGSTRLKALELLGKFRDLAIFKDVSEVQSTPIDDKTEHDLDAEFKLLAESRRELELITHDTDPASPNPA